MLQNTKGIVLKSIKYGDTSLITTIFTQYFGVQTYMVQGVRTANLKKNKTALLQPATLLELVAYQNPQKNLQRLREFQSAHIYLSLQEQIIKNSIALFSVELLLRLLPENAPLPELFDFVFDYFINIDQFDINEVANFPIYFIVQCSKILGYDLKGNYTETTPHLNLQEGTYTSQPPLQKPFVADDDAKMLHQILQVNDFEILKTISMNSPTRFRLLDWYIEFLHQHAQHLGQIKSLSILRTILH